MKRTVFAFVLAAAAYGLPPPPDASAEVALRGAPNCALWTKGRAQNGAEYEKAWLAGYFSGLSIAFDVDFWGTKGADALDNDRVWKWMDAYCAANAQDSLVQGAEKLFIERMHRAGK